MSASGRSFHYTILGLAAVVGKVVEMDDWAREFQIPDRRNPGKFLNGAAIQRLIGPVESKSWDPELFRNFQCVVDVAQQALHSAQISVNEVDVVMVATSTPYEPMLDYDSFKLLRALGIRDHIPPFQLAAGCAGMARALSLASRLEAEHILIVAYEVSSLYMLAPTYRYNSEHPLKDSLWASPALFSDGAAAVVLRRNRHARGYSVYSRDSLTFGDEPGFVDPLIHFPGGGGLNPPGTPKSDELACYGMAGPETKRYYSKGMMLNHDDLASYRPDYAHEVSRIYSHQASPFLVDGFMNLLSERTGIDKQKCATNSRKFGNLVIPSTLKMACDDLASGRISSGDELAFLVVGAGPERGAFLISLQ